MGEINNAHSPARRPPQEIIRADSAPHIRRAKNPGPRHRLRVTPIAIGRIEIFKIPDHCAVGAFRLPFISEISGQMRQDCGKTAK